jgi:transcriptional regulator with XRE-family HTH domain
MASEFGSRLKQLRTRAGSKMTLEELAKKVGSSKAYIWELENKDNVRPSGETLYKLANALDTTIGVLMGEKEKSELDEKDQVFFRNYQKLSDPNKDKLNKILGVFMEGEDDK